MRFSVLFFCDYFFGATHLLMKFFDRVSKLQRQALLATGLIIATLPFSTCVLAQNTTQISSPGSTTARPAAPTTLPALAIGIHRLYVEVANNPESRQTGLMNRDALAPDTGMLFVFPQPAVQCMWMKNTRIPLSVAFIDENSQILNIESMQPETETSHCSRGPALFALEMTQGWFAKRRIEPGERISGADPR